MDDNTPVGGPDPASILKSVHVRRLQALYDFTGRVMSFSSREETARILLGFSRKYVASDYGTITFKDIEDNIYNIIDVAGKDDLLQEVRKDPHAYITKQKGSSFWGGITRLVGETKKPYISNNVESDHERHYLKFWPDVKSNISVPILDERKNLIAILTLESKKINAYGKEDLDFLIHLSDLAALRMQTLEALEKKYKETEIWKSLTSIQREIGRFGLQGCKDILHGFLELCLHQTRTKNGYFTLVNEEKKCLERFIYIGEEVLHQDQESCVLQLGEGIDGKVAESGQPVLSNDVSGSEDYIPFFPRIQSVLAVPLIYYDQVIGVLCIASKRMNAFTDKDLQFVMEFAHDAAPTIRDAQFFDYTRSESGTGITIIGESRLIREMKELAFQAASVSQELTVLLRGASGTGKEYFARFIHFNSHRKNKPFEVINCANISGPLLESELFGHVKGAFTDSKFDKVGIFENAHGGTIFLDEIGDLEFNLQGKLLRVLEQKTFRRVGDTRLRTVDVRVITATNQDLKVMVQSGGFRQDLYFRLEQWIINLPTLKERREDIPLLVSHFLYKHRGAPDREARKITSEALAVLWRQDWPGNVRELENFVQKLIVFSGKDGNLITEDMLAEMARRFNMQLRSKISTKSGEAEKELRRALKATRKADRFNKSLAALFLGWDRNTLRQKISQFGIDEGILHNEH